MTGPVAWPGSRGSSLTQASTSTATCSSVDWAIRQCSCSSATIRTRPGRSSSARPDDRSAVERDDGMFDDGQRYLFDLQGWITIPGALDDGQLAELNAE